VASAATTAAASTSTDATTTRQTVTDTAATAEAFPATLSDEQREQLLYDDETNTTSWSDFPITFGWRAGLNLADLTEEQQAAAVVTTPVDSQ
jgi:hypothetical protein